MAPGGSLQLSATVGGELDDKIEALKIGVRCVNTYSAYERDSDGDRRRVTRTETLHEDWHEVPRDSLSLGDHGASFEIPAAAASSAEGAITWEAVARIARRRSRDVDEEWPFEVLLPAERYAEREETPAALHGGEATVRFEVPRRVPLGGKLAGTVVVVPGEELKATEVHLKFVRHRLDVAEVVDWGVDPSFDVGGARVSMRGGTLNITSNKSTITDKDEVDAAKFDGQELQAGQEYRFPFELDFPSAVPPSLAAGHTLVRWWLQLELARRMRDDVVATVELNVFNAPS